MHPASPVGVPAAAAAAAGCSSISSLGSLPLSAPPVSRRSGGGWSCRQCSLINPFYADACRVCMAAKVEEATVQKRPKQYLYIPKVAPPAAAAAAAARVVDSSGSLVARPAEGESNSHGTANVTVGVSVGAATAEPVAPSWTCHTCTFHNSLPLAIVCAACGAQRASTRARASGVSAGTHRLSGHSHSQFATEVKIKICPICQAPALRSAQRCAEENCGWNFILREMDEFSSGEILNDVKLIFPPYSRPTWISFTPFDTQLAECDDDAYDSVSVVSSPSASPHSCPAGVAATPSIFQCDHCHTNIPLGHPYFHCTTCDQKHTDEVARLWASVDFCHDCYLSRHSLDSHDTQHQWIQQIANESHESDHDTEPGPETDDAVLEANVCGAVSPLPVGSVSSPSDESCDDPADLDYPDPRRRRASASSSPTPSERSTDTPTSTPSGHTDTSSYHPLRPPPSLSDDDHKSPHRFRASPSPPIHPPATSDPTHPAPTVIPSFPCSHLGCDRVYPGLCQLKSHIRKRHPPPRSLSQRNLMRRSAPPTILDTDNEYQTTDIMTPTRKRKKHSHHPDGHVAAKSKKAKPSATINTTSPAVSPSLLSAYQKHAAALASAPLNSPLPAQSGDAAAARDQDAVCNRCLDGGELLRTTPLPTCTTDPCESRVLIHIPAVVAMLTRGLMFSHLFVCVSCQCATSALVRITLTA